MKHLMFAICLVCGPGALDARADVWQPSPGHRQVPIWPGTVPDSAPPTGPEFSTPTKTLVAGKPWVAVQRVARPTMTVYPPRGKNTGVAVIVFPGGGYNVLAIDLEGTEVCDWLTSRTHRVAARISRWRSIRGTCWRRRLSFSS